MGVPFRLALPVRFADCDPAGIVFYPRYFEMCNAVVEDWCAQGWGLAFDELIVQRGWGLPTVRVEADFPEPSRLGEQLTATLVVERIGNASVRVLITLQGPDGSDRMRARLVLVLTDRSTGRARRLPDDIRARIAGFEAG